MQKVEAYRVEIPIVATDEYSRELDKASKAIDDTNKKAKEGTKAQDDFAKSAKDVAKSQDSVSKSTRDASKGIEDIGKSAEQTEKRIGRTMRTFESFGSKVKSLQRAKANIEVTVKDNATRTLNHLRGTWDGFRRNPITRLTIFAVDRAWATLRGIRNTITSIPTMIAIGLSYVGIKNLGDATVGAAMNWEKYEVSMEHWLDGNTKKAKELTKWMGEFADITPFSSPELFPALTHAVSITDKDLNKSKRLLAIASDMAALTPGRSVEDAMQAIANSKMGNTVMLQGFGLDISKKQMDKMGGWDKLLDKLEKDFKGGAEKLSKTAAGVIATLKGYRGSFMRAIGTGFLEPMKPRLDAINQWLANNQEKWGRWKSVAMGHGKDLSEGLFSTLEKSFGYVQSRYLENPDFMNLDLKGKISYVSDDIGDYLSSTVKPKLTEWWDETGKGVALEIGKNIGLGIFEGIKLGMQAGGELLVSSYKDLYSNFKETGFSKETGKSALGALATTAGAMYLGKKLIYNPGRSVYRGGKNTKNWWDNGRDKRQARRDTKEEKWQRSNDKRIKKGLERGDKARGKRDAKELKKSNVTPKSSPKGASKILGPLGTVATFKWVDDVATEVGDWTFGHRAGDPKFNGLLSNPFKAQEFYEDSRQGVVSKFFDLFKPAKVSAAELPSEEQSNSRVRWKPSDSSHPLAAAYTPVISDLNGSGTTGAANAQFSLNTDVLQKNIDTLTTYIGEASGHIVGSFNPLKEKTNRLNHNIDVLTEYSANAVLSFVDGFGGMREKATLLNTNLEMLSATSKGAGELVQSFFKPLVEKGPILHGNIDTLTTYIGAASAYVVGSFQPLAEKGATLNGNLDTLNGYTGMASAQMASFLGASERVASLKAVVNGLTEKIRSVSIPSVSAESTPVRAYAKGGVARSPHIGLVAEAGVPEAMIPWDGSNRSKALWQQTGEALGMFSGNSSGGSEVAAVGGGGFAVNIGDINVGGGNNMSAEEIMNMIMPALYEKIVASLAKR